MGRSLIIIAVFLLTACHSPKSAVEGRDATLESASWTLRELHGVAVKVPEGAQTPFINFTNGDNVINGSGGCNTMNGMYTVHEDQIKLHKMTQTERACTDEQINLLERDFFTTLESASAYKIRKRTVEGKKIYRLELYQDDQLLAAFDSDTLKK